MVAKESLEGSKWVTKDTILCMGRLFRIRWVPISAMKS